MSETPAFSVLLSAHNEERLVGDAIRSVLAQNDADFELIVVDDGSADGTAAVVEGFLDDPRLQLIRQPNRGLPAALNTAAAAGRAPRLALIDADDLWFPGFLARLGAALDDNPGAGFAYTDAWWLQASSGRFFRRSISEYLGAPATPPEDPRELLVSLLPVNWIFGLTVIERSAYDAVGGFDETLAAAEDYDLWLRLLGAGYRAVNVAGRLAVQRDRRGSMSRRPAGMLPSLASVYRKLAADPATPAPARDLAGRRLAALEREIGAGPDAGRGALAIVRSGLASLRKQLAPASVWHRGVPAEVEAAFPWIDLARPGGAG